LLPPMHPSGVVCAALIAAVLPLSFALPLPIPQLPPRLGQNTDIGVVDDVLSNPASDLTRTPTPDSGESHIDETPGSVVSGRDFFDKILSGSLSIAQDETRRDGTGGIDQPGAGQEGGADSLGQAPNAPNDGTTNTDQGRGGNGGGPKIS
ncbi:hypothetical protein FA95DRAFT_1565098, partial [Auriscalpium vulgare]